MSADKKTIGVLVGKFLPFHKGHESMIEFAQFFCDDLYVLVDNIPEDQFEGEFISGEKRVDWIKETFPKIHVRYLPEVTPQQPDEHPDFWNFWRDTVLNELPGKPDFLFASEMYGFPFAEIIGAKYIPVNVDRSIVPISATALRDDLGSNWKYLPEATRKDFLMHVCIFGPESTGKSTLTKQLAEHYDTVHVPEYARGFLEAHIQYQKSEEAKFEPCYEDMDVIARGQIANEFMITRMANKMLFLDTDALTTSIWSKWIFDGKVSDVVARLGAEHSHDLYLLTYPDLEWEGETIRYFPEDTERLRFFEECKALLEAHKRPYVVIKGQGADRVQNAITAVDELMKEKFNYLYFARRMQVSSDSSAQSCIE